MTTPLTKIIQGAQEPYNEFVRRLLETAENVLGPEENTPENANCACKAVLRGQTKNKTLDDFVRLCSDVDTLTHAQPFSECEFGCGGCLASCWPFQKLF